MPASLQQRKGEYDIRLKTDVSHVDDSVVAYLDTSKQWIHVLAAKIGLWPVSTRG